MRINTIVHLGHKHQRNQKTTDNQIQETTTVTNIK